MVHIPTACEMKMDGDSLAILKISDFDHGIKETNN